VCFILLCVREGVGRMKDNLFFSSHSIFRCRSSPSSIFSFFHFFFSPCLNHLHFFFVLFSLIYMIFSRCWPRAPTVASVKNRLQGDLKAAAETRNCRTPPSFARRTCACICEATRRRGSIFDGMISNCQHEICTSRESDERTRRERDWEASSNVF
jgi:hypothetical protein